VSRRGAFAGAWGAALVLVACTDDSGGTGPGPPPAGTRLEARQLEVDGAPPLVLGIWDTREMVPCRFMTAEDGKLRCLPEVAKLLATADVYADSECQTPIMWADPRDQVGSADHPVTVPLARSGCDPVRYQVWRPLPPGSPLFATSSTGGCAALDTGARMPPVMEAVPFALAPAADWEPGTESSGLQVSDRLRLVETVTADGFRFVDRLVDDHWGMSCTLQVGPTLESVECRPPVARQTGALYADDACTVSLYGSDGCQDVAYIEYGTTPVALGARFVGPLFYKALLCDPGGTATAEAADAHYYLKGDPLGADAVAPVRYGMMGTGRFQLRGLMRDGGGVASIPDDLFYFASSPYFDTVANEDCRPIWTSDGQVRCVTSSTAIVIDSYFSDAACSRFVFSCDKGAACDTQKVLRMSRDAAGLVDATILYGTSSRLGPSDVYYRDPSVGICFLAGTSATGFSEVSGPELPLDTFAVLHERHPLPAVR